MVLEQTLESPLDCKEIQPVHSKGDQSWVFFVILKLRLQYFGPPHVKSWLIGKDPDAGRDWGQEEKGMTEDEMAGWYHRLDGHEFEWTLGVGDGQGGLAFYNSWVRKESDTTERLNWTELNGKSTEQNSASNGGLWTAAFLRCFWILVTTTASFELYWSLTVYHTQGSSIMLGCLLYPSSCKFRFKGIQIHQNSPKSWWYMSPWGMQRLR